MAYEPGNVAAGIKVELVYIKPDQQVVMHLAVAAGVTIREVIQQSGLLQQFPELALKQGMVGVYSQVRDLDDVVVNGDRVEIYRPLLADPKESRRRRAQQSG